MIHEIFEKHDNFRGPTAYVLRPDRGYRLDCSVGPQAGIDEIVEEFTSYWALNRRVQKPVFHAAINLAPGESLSDEQWRFVAKTYLQALGFNDSAYLVAKHTNKAHEHIHIVASRIDASGRCVSDSNDYAKGERVMRTLEMRLGLSRLAPSLASPGRALSGDEVNAALSSRTPNLRFELQQEVSQAAQGATLRAMVEQLKLRGVAVHLHGGSDATPVGISFEVEGQHLAGSSLGRAFTWAGLQRHYGLQVTSEDASCIAERLVRTEQAPPLPASLRRSVDLALNRNPATLGAFVAELGKSEITVTFHLSPAGEPRGISYHYQGETRTGSELGKRYTLGGLARRGVRFLPSSDSALVAQLASQKATSTRSTDLSTWKGAPPSEDTWSRRALRELRTRLAQLRPAKGFGRRELSAALFQLRRAPAAAIRTAAHAQYLFSALTSPQRAARLLLQHVPAGKPIADLLAFAAAFRSPRAAVLFALRLSHSKLRTAPDPLARRLIDSYVTAALADSPRASIARLAEAGIRVDRHAGKLVLTLADQTLPAQTLGPAYQHLKAAYAHFTDSGSGTTSNPSPRPFLSTRPSRTDAPELLQGSCSGVPLRAQPPGSPARDSPPRPQQDPRHASSPAPVVATLDTQPDRTAPPASHLDHRPPRVASATRGSEPGDNRDRLQRLVLRSSSSGGRPASQASQRGGISQAIELHLQALQSPFDLRIMRADRPPTTLYQVSQEEIRAMIPMLSDLCRQGAQLLVRSPQMQLLSNVPRSMLADLAKRGFEPAVAVRTTTDVCDVWIRHPVSSLATPYLRRVAALEYGARPGPASNFGHLATSLRQILASSGRIFSRAADLQPLFAFHHATHMEALRKACEAIGVPTLSSFRASCRFSSGQADRHWCQAALKAGLSPQGVFTSLLAEGSRRLDPRPEAAVRYAARTLGKGLSTARSLNGSALTNLVLRSVASSLAIPLEVLRLGVLAVGTVLRRSRSH